MKYKSFLYISSCIHNFYKFIFANIFCQSFTYYSFYNYICRCYLWIYKYLSQLAQMIQWTKLWCNINMNSGETSFYDSFPRRSSSGSPMWNSATYNALSIILGIGLISVPSSFSILWSENLSIKKTFIC